VRTVNGPALPFADGENSLAVLPPQGFQVIEEMLFPKYDINKSAELLHQAALLKQIFLDIRDQKDPYGFQDKYVWDAMRLEMYRLISLGVSGFDSQSAENSVPEAAAVIISLKDILRFYSGDIHDSALVHKLDEKLTSAVKYLNAQRNFNAFDRLTFIRLYANPLSEMLVLCTEKLNYNLPSERRLLSPSAPNLFAYSFYDPSVYSPNEEANATEEKILLGRKLFFDNILSANNERSCASCHQPSKAFTDGLSKSLTLNDKDVVTRNAPTLLNAAFQPKQFFDSRAVFMEQQVFEVVHNPKEMGGSLASAVKRIQKDSSYLNLFDKAYAYTTPAVSEENITNAIASYLRRLVSLNSRFDAYMHGNNKALNKDEVKALIYLWAKQNAAPAISFRFLMVLHRLISASRNRKLLAFHRPTILCIRYSIPTKENTICIRSTSCSFRSRHRQCETLR
jgi:cytochrome c peroxidase